MASKDGEFDIDRLRISLKNSPSEVSSLLLKTMLDSFKERVCINQCQFNRVICILRPKCPKRHFQDLLLQSGYKFSQIPQFCYSVRLKEIHESYSRDLPFPADTTIFITDFHRIFGDKKSRHHPTSQFKKILAHFDLDNVVEITKTFFVVGCNKNVMLVDVEQELVILNPDNWKIDNYELANAIIQVLAREYELEVNIQEEHEFLMVLTFNLQNLVNSSDNSKLEEIIRHSDSLMGYDADLAEIYGEIHIPQHTITEDDLNLQILREMFDDLAPLQQNKSITTETAKAKSSRK